MRQLIAKDIAPFTKILKKMDLKESIKTTFDGTNTEKGEMVSELIWAVIENYHKAEKEFFSFLAKLENKKIEEIEQLPLAEFIALIQELFSAKNLPFFKLAAK